MVRGNNTNFNPQDENKKPMWTDKLGSIATAIATFIAAIALVIAVLTYLDGKKVETPTTGGNVINLSPIEIAPTPTAPSSTTPITSLTPSKKDLDAVGDNIIYPKASSYLDAYETMYVKSTKGQGIYAYWAPDADEGYRKTDAILEATEVTVLARENGMSCIIYINERDHQHAAWVNSERLVYDYQ